MYGHTCCFCRQGSGATVQVASNPLGPWTNTGMELNPLRAHSLYRTIQGQNSFVFRVPSSSVLASAVSKTENAFTTTASDRIIFASDLWSSSLDGLKSHDLQYWQPLEFDDTKSPPMIVPLVWRDWFVLDV